MCKYSQMHKTRDAALQSLADLAPSAPNVLRRHMNGIFTLCADAAVNTLYDISYRKRGLRVLALCQTSQDAISEQVASLMPSLMPTLGMQFIFLTHWEVETLSLNG